MNMHKISKGIVKEILSLGLAVVFQSNELSAINFAGLVVCLIGIILHVLRKTASMQEKETATAKNGVLR